MERIRFVPSVDEVIEVAQPHLKEAEDAIVSFGQGCEGEPLIQWRLLERSIRQLRVITDRGTIHLNTNGSFPDRVANLCDAGLDSLRVTLNSPHRKYYNRYHKPKGYTFGKIVIPRFRCIAQKNSSYARPTGPPISLNYDLCSFNHFL